MYCLGSTVNRALRFPIFLSCFFSFTQALCQQSQLPETNPVNSGGEALCAGTPAPAPSVPTLPWLCCSRLMPLDQLLLHSSSQPSPRLGTFSLPEALASRPPYKTNLFCLAKCGADHQKCMQRLILLQSWETLVKYFSYIFIWVSQIHFFSRLVVYPFCIHSSRRIN